MKTKKIGERSKKKNPGKKDKKALSEKKKPGKALGAAAEIDSDISERKKAKEKLHENEERMRAIIEGTPHLFFYTQDAEANTTYVSPTIEHITGYKTDVWLKRGDWFITDATMNKVAKERTHANLQGKFTEEPILLEIHHASGHRILLEIYEYPITKNGRIVGLQGVAHDITQRKLVASQKEAALEMLQESEERYRQLVELSPDSIAVHSEGKIVFVNPAAVKLMGAQYAEELLGKPVLEMVHPDFRSIAVERIRQSIKLGCLALPYAEKFIRVDGSAVEVEVSAIPIVYKGKQAMQVIARDITERKRSEEEIKMLATALKRINECVSITDVENTILFVNEAFLKTYGYSEQELIGQNIKIVRPPNSPQEVFEEVLPGTLSGGWTGELINRRKDSSEFPIYLATSIIEKKDGKPNCLIGIAIDITERKRAELQIKEVLETLRRSEENFRRSMDDSPLGVRVATVKGETIYANKVLLDIYGYANVEELNKIPIKERYTPQSYAEFHMRKKDRGRGDFGPSEYEINIVGKNKEIRHLLVLRKEVLWNGTKQFQVIYQDITERKQAESEREDALAALRESEGIFNQFLTASPVLVYIKNEKHRFNKLSKSFEDLFGKPTSELIGKDLYDLLPPELAKIVYEDDLKVLKGGVRVNAEERLNDKVFSSIKFPIHRESGKPDYLGGFSVDITERKQVEDALRISEERYRTFVENASVGFFRTKIDGSAVLDANPKLCQILGLTREEFVGQPSAIAWAYPERRAELVRLLREKGIVNNFEIDVRTKAGEIRTVLMSMTTYPELGYLEGGLQDITERKWAEEALSKSEEKFRKAFNTSPDSVAITRLEDGMYISINPGFTKITGYTEEDIFRKTAIGDNIWDNIEDRQRLVAGLKKHGEVTNLEAAFRMKDGNIRYGLMSASIIDLAGVPHFLSITRDITDRKKAEEKIRNSLAEKEVLLKEVHHRVKNNLMIIIGLIKMQETKAANEMFNPLMQELEGRIRAMALVHEGLYKSADLAHVNLQNYIEMMSTQIYAQFGADRDICFSVQAVGVDVDLDIAVPCGLILNELIANAFKHAFPDGRPGSGAGNCGINVIVNQEGGVLTLIVADNGVGLPADLDWEKSETLGLRLIKMLSKQINGSLELDRSAGAVFCLKFPVAV